jgi:hypothetical protein
MPKARLLLAPLLAFAAVSCGKAPPPITLKKIGEPCTADTDCGGTLNGMTESLLCKNNLCTKVCTGQLDCPDGFDCGLALAMDTMPTCYPSPMNPDPGGFGTDCSLVAPDPKTGTACSMGTSPCAAGFTCHSTVKCDPRAYCTTSCMADTDCPPQYYCALDASTKNMFCRKRDFCVDCQLDDQCNAPFTVCTTDSVGGHFCAKPCGGDDDCRQPQNGNGYFEKCLADQGGKGKVCQPAPAKGMGKPNPCHGPSAVNPSQMNTVCSGCRPGVPSDCAMATNGFCFVDSFTTERFCTKPCTKDGDCGTNLYCLVFAPGMGYCTGDTLGTNLTCYP